MVEPSTICITIPSSGGRCWVFVDPSRPNLEFNRECALLEEARAYAHDLAGETGWPIENASVTTGATLEPRAGNEREIQINEILWLMTTLVHDEEADNQDPMFWANAARRQAEAIASTAGMASDENCGAMLAVGAAMLHRASLDLEYASVDDVLATIMVLGDGDQDGIS